MQVVDDHHVARLQIAVGDALRKASITGSTIVGGHGTTAKQADIGAALAAN